MAYLSSSFQYWVKQLYDRKTIKKYALDYVEEVYENPGEQAPMGLMALGE